MRGQLIALTTILTIKTALRSGEIFAGLIGRNALPQLSNVVLTMERFILGKLTESPCSSDRYFTFYSS